MRNRVRSAMMAVAAVGVVAAVAPGLAAGIAVPTTSPAAGQGVAEVQGFEVCNIEWTVSNADEAMVTEIRFKIEREKDGTGTCGTNTSTVGSVAAENSGNAIVRVQLRAVSAANDGTFASCNTTTGSAVCPLTGGQSIKAEDLKDVNIIAFDRT
jgi:hypothetical protein